MQRAISDSASKLTPPARVCVCFCTLLEDCSDSFFKLIFFGVQLIYNVVLVSAVQQRESVIHIHMSTLFQIIFQYRSLQSIEQSSLCYTVDSYQLFILYIVVCICQSQSPNLCLPHFPVGNHKFVFYTCDSISVLQISSFVPFF